MANVRLAVMLVSKQGPEVAMPHEFRFYSAQPRILNAAEKSSLTDRSTCVTEARSQPVVAGLGPSGETALADASDSAEPRSRRGLLRLGEGRDGRSK